MTSAIRSGPGLRVLLRIVGAGLLVATAAIHLDLYLTGYRSIPTIGGLFLLQIIVGFGLAALVLLTGNRLVAAAAAIFALSTLGGYLISVQFGLFNFREVRTTAGIVAGILEVGAFIALAAVAAMPGPTGLPATGRQTGLLHRHSSDAGSTTATLDSARLSGVREQHGLAALAGRSVPYAAPAVVAVSVVALGLFAGALAGAGGTGVSGPSATSASSGNLGTQNIGGTTVLTNSQGRTLYWFAPDTSGKSLCNGQCAQYWPPVPGPAHAGNGVTGTLGTIHRTDGSVQETYNGHPLYTYVGDSGPGQANGNGLNLNGGLWHEVVAG